ncbi:MAG: hypothetical protein QM753_01105 [Thermomicrobiales bacterium]
MNGPLRSTSAHLLLPAIAPRAMIMKAVRPSNHANVPLRQSKQQGTIEPHIPIDVRLVALRDLLPLHSISERFALDMPFGDMVDDDPMRVGLRQIVPFMRHDHPMVVARTDRRLLGYASFQVVGPDQRWLLCAVGSNMGIFEADPLWEELLRGAIVTAGLDGTKRLFARLPSGCPVLPAARRIGFTPYVSETVWASALVPIAQWSRRRGVRRQTQSDVWSIHQLYMVAVPRQVQYAEAITSHSWDLAAQSLPGGARVAGWLVEADQQVAAYARVLSYPSAHAIEVLVLPEQREVFRQLLSAVFSELGQLPARRVYLTLRGYQAELCPVLEEFGMSVHLEQDVHIKYTTATTAAATSNVNLSPFSADVKEPSAKRVPTFIKKANPDPSSDGVGMQ